MNSMKHYFGAAVVIFAAGVAPCVGQTTSPVSVVHEYVPSSALAPGQLAIPSNVKVSSVYWKLVDEMLGRSPTFRRQMIRLAAAPYLTVRLQAAAPSWQRGVRATTKFDRDRSGRLTAHIEIAPMIDATELIAHEIEHVIEQLDQIDLEAKASQARSGVRATVSDGIFFETTRASRIGLQVAHEVR
jgi:hypothetical protein